MSTKFPDDAFDREDEKTTLHEGEGPVDDATRRLTGAPKMACLVALNGELRGTRFDVDRPLLSIGRARGMDIRLAGDDFVSRHHADIVATDGRYELRDLESTNGTYVNSKRVELSALSDGDRLHIGTNVFKFLHTSDLENAWLDEMYRLATRDPLTDLFNKHYLLEQLDAKLSAVSRYEEPLAVLMVDVDHFKKVNDTHGHVAGDAVLRGIAHRLMQAVRQEDLVCRFGGEEFVLVALKANAEAASVLAERVRSDIERRPFEFRTTTVQVTVSVGVCVLDPAERLTTETVLRRADEAMYHAKEAGRNRVARWSPAPSPQP
ncbi:MAG: GGDEF domain-containing protein [Nitrospirae bacterium]|nr:GGDEF domain-containing protein [Nitrospirota bacterium]